MISFTAPSAAASWPAVVRVDVVRPPASPIATEQITGMKPFSKHVDDRGRSGNLAHEAQVRPGALACADQIGVLPESPTALPPLRLISETIPLFVLPARTI